MTKLPDGPKTQPLLQLMLCCIGAAYAEFALKLVLATTVSKYDLTLSSDRPIKPVLSGLNLVPSDGVKMKFLGTRVSDSFVEDRVLAI